MANPLKTQSERTHELVYAAIVLPTNDLIPVPGCTIGNIQETICGIAPDVVVFSALQLCALRSTTDSWRRRRMHMVFTRYVLSHTRDVAELAGGCIDMMNQISDVCNGLERVVLSTVVVEMVYTYQKRHS